MNVTEMLENLTQELVQLNRERVEAIIELAQADYPEHVEKLNADLDAIDRRIQRIQREIRRLEQ